MPNIFILRIEPATIKIDGEGVIVTLPIPGLDQTKVEIYDLTLTIGGHSFAVTEYQRGFEFADWTFSFRIPDSLSSLPLGSYQMTVVNFKILYEGQVFDTVGDFLMSVEIDNNEPPFSITSISPTSIEIDKETIAEISLTGTGLDTPNLSTILTGPTYISTFFRPGSATNRSIEIDGKDVNVFGKYRIIICTNVHDSILTPIYLDIREKVPMVKIDLFAATPDELSPGDSFTLHIDKSTTQNDWDDLSIEEINLEVEGSSEISHGSVVPVSVTEGFINCSVSTSLEIASKKEATLSLTASYKEKPAIVTNTLLVTVMPGSHPKTFILTSSIPNRANADNIKDPAFRFILVGQNLSQITGIRLGNSCLMNILSRTPTRIQCKFLNTSYQIPEGLYRFTVRYKDPESGAEEQKIAQNIRIKVTEEQMNSDSVFPENSILTGNHQPLV